MVKRLITALLLSLFSIGYISSSPYSVDDLLLSLRTNNTDLRSIDLDIYNAELDVKDAKAAYYPQINMSMASLYMTNPPVGPVDIATDDILSGLSVPGGLNGGYIRVFDGMENTYYNASVSLTQPLITWGKIPLSVKLFKTASSIQSLRRTDKERQLEAELIIRIYSLKYLNEIFSILEEMQSNAAELVEISRSSRDSGVMTDLDLLENEILSKETGVAISEVVSNMNNLVTGIATITGLSELSVKDIVFPEDTSYLRKYSSESLSLLQDKATNPAVDSLKMINKLSSVHKLQEDIYYRSMYGVPDFAMNLSLSYGGSRFPLFETGWMQKDDWSVNIAFVMQSNLWDGGKTLNNISRAKASQEEDRISYDKAVLELRGAVSDSYNAMLLSLSKLDYLSLKGESLGKRLESTVTEFEKGSKGKADVIQDRISFQKNEIEKLKETINITQNVFMLDYLCGEEFTH